VGPRTRISSLPAFGTNFSSMPGIGAPMQPARSIGQCTQVIDGEPEHRDVHLTESEHARNDQFTPCCLRAKSPVPVLDL